MSDSAFKRVSHHPLGLQTLDTVGSALHAVCAAKCCTWQRAYEHLIEAASALGRMPQDRQTIRHMLGQQGFFLQAGAYAGRSIRSMIAECDRSFQGGEVMIVNLLRSAGSGCYIPLVPVTENGTVHYEMHYPADLLHCIAEEAWIAWQDGQDHSVMPRRRSTRTARVSENHTEEHAALHVFNENPNDNLIGDCAVRAVAGVLGIPWGEAVRRLAAAQDYHATVINASSNIEALLAKEGFQEFDAIRRGGHILTGKEFCDHIHDMFQAGTRIFAYVGSSHAVAILVFDDDYKIVDTWDSTDRKITKYWAKYPEKPRRRPRQTTPDKLTELTVGTRILHRVYGAGEVTAVADAVATVCFGGQTEKQMTVAWILANCKPG